MKKTRILLALGLIGWFFLAGIGQLKAQVTVTNPVTANGFTIKKQVSNSTVPSGVVFTYTIFYTIPAGASNVVITDQIPASLVIDNVVPGSGCGTPTVTVAGNLVSYALASVSSGCSGTFQINVHFPAGTTCPQTTARNQVCLEAKDQPKICTEFVSTTATAANPFTISKGVTGLSWNPQNNGCQYIMAAGGNVTYTLMVYKASPFQGNDDGQINLNNAVVTDILPAGATLVSSTCGAMQSGNTITWNVGNLNAANPWVWQSCQITVNYPAGTFPAPTQITNMATLSGTNACNQPFSQNSNQTCVQVAPPISSGTFSKSVYLNNKMPGCKGIYYINFCNNGNTPLTFNISDVIPSNLTINSIYFNASAPVTASATLANSSVSTISSSATGNVNWTAPTVSPVAALNFSQAGLAPGACLQIQLYFTINSTVAPNTTITNCANMTSTQIPAQQACVSFVTSAPAPDLCLYKEICSPQVGYTPGSIFRYRLRVQNIGSANANGFNLSDILDPNLIYVGNQLAYFGNAYNTPCGGAGATTWPISNPSVSGNTLTWTGLNIPAECQDFYYANCGAYGTQGVTFYFIEFDVKVAPDAASGIVPNTFTGNGGNLPAGETSNVVNTIVNVTHGTELTKELSLDNSTWTTSATITPGGSLYYRLNMKNTGTGPLYDVRKVDLLALNDTPNDWKILNRTSARGSQFGVAGPSGYTYAVAATPPATGTANTMAGNNLSILNSLGVAIGTTTDAWPYAGSGNNVGIGFGASYALSGGGGTLRSSFKVTVSPNAQVNQKVCNDFGSRGSGKYIINGALTYTPLTPAASNVVCATATQAVNCCEKTVVTPVQGKCCVRITTECPVKQVQVFVIGGTISNASWNCTASLGAYLGQSNYSFAPNSCVLNPMDICFNALPTNTTGSISVNFVFTFDNGQVCEKQVKLDGCKPPVPSDCCGDWKLTFKNSWFKKTGVFEYTNPSTTKTICSVNILAAAGLTPGQYLADSGPLQTMTSTNLITFTPPAVNYIKFWMSASLSYSSNIILQVNYCDGTYCLDTLKWKGSIIDHDVATLSVDIPAKLYGVQLEVDPGSKYFGEVAAMAVSLDGVDPEAGSGPYIFAASVARNEGELLREEQSFVTNAWMSAANVYATMPTAADYIGRFIPVKRLAIVIADDSGAKRLPALLVTYFDSEGNALVTKKISDYIAAGVTTPVEEVLSTEADFTQVNIYPNPAKDNATFTFAIGRARTLRIDLFDAQGKLVKTLEQGFKSAGYHQVSVDVSNVPGGLYFVRMQSEGAVQTQRLSVVK